MSVVPQDRPEHRDRRDRTRQPALPGQPYQLTAHGKAGGVRAALWRPARDQPRARDAGQPPLRELERSQWWSPEQLRDLQEQKLLRLVAHAYAHVPLYRRLWEAHGVQPEDIRSLDDLPKLPLVDKQALRGRLSRRSPCGQRRSPSTGALRQQRLHRRALAVRHDPQREGATLGQHVSLLGLGRRVPGRARRQRQGWPRARVRSRVG